MTKLPGNLRRGGTTFIMRALARRRRARAARPRADDARSRACPTQLALMLRHPDFDAYDLDERAATSSSAAGRSRPASPRKRARRFGAALATRYSCTEAGIGLGTAFDDPDEDAVVSVGRPHASVELAVLDDDDRPVAGRRGRRGVPALPRGDVGLLARPRSDARPRSPPTASCAPATSVGSTTSGRLRLVGRSKEMYVRGGYNVYPGRGRGRALEPPGVAAVAVVPRADPRDGRDRRRRGRPARPGARRRRSTTLRELRRRPTRRRTSCPRRCRSSTRCRSPRWRRSTAARSPSRLEPSRQS